MLWSNWWVCHYFLFQLLIHLGAEVCKKHHSTVPTFLPFRIVHLCVCTHTCRHLISSVSTATWNPVCWRKTGKKLHAFISTEHNFCSSYMCHSSWVMELQHQAWTSQSIESNLEATRILQYQWLKMNRLPAFCCYFCGRGEWNISLLRHHACIRAKSYRCSLWYSAAKC